MIPPKPACHNQWGRITCDCFRNGIECAGNRILWMHGQHIADLPDNAARRAYTNGLPSAYQPHMPTIRAIAMQIIKNLSANAGQESPCTLSPANSDSSVRQATLGFA